MATQWNVGGMGKAIGLSYTSLDFVMKINKVKNKIDCFGRVRIMERRALELMKDEGSDGSTT